MYANSLLIARVIITCEYFVLDRVGSEFWNQQVRIGNDVTGIKWVAHLDQVGHIMISSMISAQLWQDQKKAFLQSLNL